MQNAATTPLTNHKKNHQPRFNRNQQYSITALTDGGGSIVERYAYTAYSQVTILDTSLSQLATSAEGNRYTYTGREWDEGLSLYHYRARMYDVVAGRLVSRDPIGFCGTKWLLYKFLGCKPLRYLDPSGLQNAAIPVAAIPPIEALTLPIDPRIFTPQPPLGRITSTCQSVVDQLKANPGYADRMNPVIPKALDCNVNIYCEPRCGRFDGVAQYISPNGHGHICLSSRRLDGQRVSIIEAMIIHEATDIEQYLDANKCACRSDKFVGRKPPVRPGVGGSDCDECEDAEIPAYRNQAEHLYPSHLPDAEAFYKGLIKSGLCISCGGACAESQECHFPEVPFPL